MARVASYQWITEKQKNKKNVNLDVLRFKQNWKLVWIKKGRLQLSCGFMTQITPTAAPPHQRTREAMCLYILYSQEVTKRDCMVPLEQWLAFVLFHLSYHCEHKEGDQKENIKAQQVQGWYDHSLEQSSSLGTELSSISCRRQVA